MFVAEKNKSKFLEIIVEILAMANVQPYLSYLKKIQAVHSFINRINDICINLHHQSLYHVFSASLA